MMLKALVILSFFICYSVCLPRKPNGQKIKSGNLCRTTTDSRNPGAKCIFPFKFKGKTYNGCPPDLKDPSRNWCSTNVDSEGNHVRGGGNYGFCDPLYCPTHTEEGGLLFNITCFLLFLGKPWIFLNWLNYTRDRASCMLMVGRIHSGLGRF